MRVEPATIADIPVVRATYEAARATQRARQSPVWPMFQDAAFEREIEIGSLFCVKDGASLAGVFSMLDADPLIWGADERGEHLYLHRIARAGSYAGRGLVTTVIDWAFQQCSERKRAGLRIDTWASNDALIALYVAHGFRLLGTRELPADPQLSVHYHGTVLAFLEAPCRSAGARTNE